MLNSHWRAFTIDAQEIPQCDCAFVWITSRTILPLPDFRSASAMPGEDLSEINRSLHQGADAPSDKIKDETIAISEKLLQLPGIQGTRYRGRLGCVSALGPFGRCPLKIRERSRYLQALVGSSLGEPDFTRATRAPPAGPDRFS